MFGLGGGGGGGGGLDIGHPRPGTLDPVDCN